MSNGGSHGNYKRRGRKGKKNKQTPGVRQDYTLDKYTKENEVFFDYVRLQKFVPEEELEQFEAVLKTELPASFRINRALPEKDEFVSFLKTHYFEPLRKVDDPDVHCPEEIPFIPYAYQTSNSRAAVRSSSLLSSLHQLLVNETTAGNISRQEAVSMIPPLLLDIQPQHYVLDACASPGSKTMQIVELMHEAEQRSDGLLVANDVDNTRCYLLVHQTLKRLPTPNVVIVNHDASLLPAPLDADGKVRLFDRVLCDVICSGDGTFRKNIELWKQWSPQKALALHKLQQNIASRCLEVLAVGGLMVYSTCSMNPIEDEAVLARLLRKYPNCLELVDVSDQLPALKRSPGISTWKVVNNRLEEFATYEEAQAADQKAIVPSMFPPMAEEAAAFHLERSFRILPHVHNSGGFFIAVIRKTKEFEDKLEITPKSAPYRIPAKKRRTMKEDPFVFLEGHCEDLKESLKREYGATDSFPWSNLLGRSFNVDKKNAVYFVNDALRDFLKQNVDRFRVINAGVQTFRKVDKVGCCDFRLSQDSISTILPFINKRIVDLEADEVAKIIAGHNDQHYTPLDELKSKDKLSCMSPGSIVVRMHTGTYTKAISAWLGSTTISAFITREEKVHLLTMLGKDTAKLQTALTTTRRLKNEKQKTAAAAKKEADGEGDGDAEESMEAEEAEEIAEETP